MGGLSPHRRRGVGAIQDPEVRKRIAKLGGLATKQRHEHDRGYLDNINHPEYLFGIAPSVT